MTVDAYTERDTLAEKLGLEPIFKSDEVKRFRMEPRYSLRAFQADLDVAQPLLERAKEQATALLEYTRECTRKFSSVHDVQLVGSTNPHRMTCVIDPVTPDNKFPCDFDLVVVSKSPLAKDEQYAILASAFDESVIGRTTICNKKRTPYVSTWVNKFPVNAVVWAYDADSLPMQYAAQASISERQRRITQGLRLYSMRTGTYGGFTRGLKGIVFEQIAKESEDLSDALRRLHAHACAPVFEVTNPINGDNLVKRVQQDVHRRLVADLEKVIEDDSLPALPYTMFLWALDHPDMNHIRFLSEDKDPHKVYRAVDRILSATCEKAMHLVLPQYRSNEVLVAAEVAEERRSEFLEEFYKVREDLAKR